MDILINNEKIEFSLDNEKNCLEVIEGLAAWLESQDFYLSELSLNGKEFYLQKKDDLRDYSLNSIKEIAITALNRQEMTVRDLNTVSEYFLLYEQALNEENKEIMTELGSQYGNIKKSLPSLLMMNPYIFDSTLNKLMEESGILTGEPFMSKKEELTGEWNQIQTLIQGRIGELSTPETEGLKTVNTLKKLIPRLEEVGMLFQSGKDREALDLIIVLSELFSKSLRILAALSEKDTPLSLPQDFMKELNEILEELAQAIETGDTILTGDLAEYEIVPKIEVLNDVFTNITKGETLC